MNYSQLISTQPCPSRSKKSCHTKSFTINLSTLTRTNSKSRSPVQIPRFKWSRHNLNLSFHPIFLILISIIVVTGAQQQEHQMNPNGFTNNNPTSSNGVFMQLPFSNPPTLRPPPYSESDEQCPEINERENWVDTLCGDLNRGYVPINPLGHKFPDGSSYPFETIKNKTLQFFRHALPVLKRDKSLPKVARFNPYQYQPNSQHRSKRSATQAPLTQDVIDIEPSWPTNDSAMEPVEGRSNRGRGQPYFGLLGSNAQSRFCEKQPPTGSLSYFHRLCKLYNAMWGSKPHSYQQNQHQNQRFQDSNEQRPNFQQHYVRQHLMQQEDQRIHSAEAKTGVSAESTAPAPATPCPSSAEYLTPVFARNHEGAWRYVVQIPREGYFTQTVEVTKCSEANCFYMEGSCRTSPRWQSLLVAEMFYPDTAFPKTRISRIKPPQDFSQYQQYLQKRMSQQAPGKDGVNDISSGVSPTIPPQCDGIDEIGCFQVRLFYDWFLIPGSCKCWKRQFDFTRVHQSR